ncbi:MAG TPA: APC family permease, partial [Dehalococcoidia bacterium]|nr:APC family permease [Dehalococcoidia bacterium]
DESDMLGSSRLGYAMAAEGFLPHPLASIHKRFGTPHVALITQAALAIGLSFVDQLSRLITFAVFNLSFSFLLCALALIRLQKVSGAETSRWRRTLPFLGGVVAIGLLIATSQTAKIAGVCVIGVGTVVYLVSAPRVNLPHALHYLTETERVLAALARRRMRFLGGLVGWLGGHRTPP